MNSLTPSEFAERVGRDISTVRRWIKRKYIKCVRVGPRGHIRIPEDQLKKSDPAAVAYKPMFKTVEEAQEYLSRF